MTVNKNQIVTSPAAIALWPKLNQPNTKFNEAGEYEATIVLDPKNAEHEAFMSLLDTMYSDAVDAMATEHKKPKIKKADSPVRPLTDKDGNDLGQFKVKFKLAASGETKDGRKFERKPALFGTDGRPFSGVIGHNSEIRVAFRPSAYFVPSVGAGLSLRLEAVQVLRASDGSRNFNDYGFTATASEPEAVETEATIQSDEDF